MTNEELAIRIKAGETKLMPELWAQVEKFVYMQADKFYNTYSGRCIQMGIKIEDLYQEGYFAIRKAVDGYNTKKGVKFLTYADYHIKHSFFSITKMNYDNWQNNAVRRATSIEAPLNEEGFTLADVVADNTDVENFVVDKLYADKLASDLESVISEFSQSWQELIQAIYFQNLRAAEVARRTGRDRATVSQKHRRVLKALRANESIQAYALC